MRTLTFRFFTGGHIRAKVSPKSCRADQDEQLCRIQLCKNEANFFWVFSQKIVEKFDVCVASWLMAVDYKKAGIKIPDIYYSFYVCISELYSQKHKWGSTSNLE